MADEWTARPTLRSMPARCCRRESRSTVWWNSGRNWPRVRTMFARTVTERLMMYAVNRQTGIFRYAAGSRASFGRPRKTTTSCRRSSWESSTATRSAGRVWTPRSKVTRDHMFITKKHIPRRAVLKGAGVALALPFLDAMVPAGTALAQTAAVPKLRTGFFYIPHGAIMGNTSHGPPLDKWTPSRRRRRFQTQSDPCVAGAVQEVRDVVRESGERRHGGLGSFVYARHVAQRHPSGYRRVPARTWPRLSIR